MKTIVFTDLDKTLLNDDHEITKENLLAIHMLINNDVKLIFSSGRSYQNIKTEILDKYNLNIPVISLNGSQIYLESGVLIQSYPIKDEITSLIIDKCDKNDVFYLLFTDSQTYANNTPNMIENLYQLARVKSKDIKIILKGMQIYFNLFYKYKLLDDNMKKKL